MGQGGQIPALAVPLGVLVVLHGPVRAFWFVVDHGAVDDAMVPDSVAAAQGTRAVDGAVVHDAVQVVQGDALRNGQSDPLIDAQRPAAGDGDIFRQSVVGHQIEVAPLRILRDGGHSGLQRGVAHTVDGGHGAGGSVTQGQAAHVKTQGPAAHADVLQTVPLEEDGEHLGGRGSARRGHRVFIGEDAVIPKGLGISEFLPGPLHTVHRSCEAQHGDVFVILHAIRGLELEGEHIVARIVGGQGAGNQVQ